MKALRKSKEPHQSPGLQLLLHISLISCLSGKECSCSEGKNPFLRLTDTRLGQFWRKLMLQQLYNYS